jgi:hypothetical protein
LPIVTRRADGIFLHGGVSPAYAGWSVERFNEAARAEIAGLDDCRAQLLAEGTAHETLDLSDRTIEARAELEALQQRLARTPSARAGELELSIATLQRCTDYQSWILIAEDGPVWFRGLARWSEEEGLREATRLLAELSASYFVAGHTPQSSGRIQRRFGGLAYLIDTGMLRVVYKGTPSALEIVGDRFFALYPEAKEELEGPEPVASATSAAIAPAAVP